MPTLTSALLRLALEAAKTRLEEANAAPQPGMSEADLAVLQVRAAEAMKTVAVVRLNCAMELLQLAEDTVKEATSYLEECDLREWSALYDAEQVLAKADAAQASAMAMDVSGSEGQWY
jgi:hypothetical protein